MNTGYRQCEMGVREESYMAKKSKPWLKVRYIQGLMVFLALTQSMCARVSMSLAIVVMTDSDNDNSFDWSLQRQSVILSTFTWGYIILKGFSGQLAARFGGKNLLLLSIGINALISLLLPMMAFYGGWRLVCIGRFLQGFFQGYLFPMLHYLIGKWAPLDEKSRMAGFIFAGTQFGTALQYVTSGYVASYWGWPAIFYVNGAVGMVWAVAYWLVGSDSPQVSKMISAEERFHIQSSLGQIGGHKNFKTPWKSIFTSLPFLSMIVASCGATWGFWTLLTEMPTYMNSVHGVNIKKNGVLSSLPYITMFLMNFPVGYISDYTLKKKWLSVTACRKIANSIGFFGPAIGLICLSFVPAGDVTLTVILLVISFASKAGYYNGYLLVPLDMAPNFASTLMSICSVGSHSISLFAPLTVGFVVKDEKNPSEWRKVFMIAAFMYTITNVFFITFGTGKKQKWNEGVEKSPKNETSVINSTKV